jgi:hypothetical protein
LIAVVIIIAVVVSSYLASQRRDAMRELAESLGLQFQPKKDYSYDERYPFLNKLCQGDDRHATNVIAGQYRGHAVQAFDYHYETHSSDSKGNRQTHHHSFSFFILTLERDCPELLIYREGWMSKVAQFFGFDDIDFESAEFSRKFAVKSPDKKFAYDICHGQMIEFLLAHPDLSVEIERHCLTLFFAQRLRPDQIQYNLDRLIAVREMFPGYLFQNESES